MNLPVWRSKVFPFISCFMFTLNGIDQDLEPASLARRSIALWGKLRSPSQYICPDPEEWEYENMDAPFMEVLWQMSMCFLYLGPVAVHVVLAVCWILASLPHPRIFRLMRPRCSIITRQTFPWDSCRLLQGQEEIQALWIQVHSLPLHLSPPRQSKTWADMLKFNSDDKTLTPPAPLLWKKEFQQYLNL